MLLKLQLCQEAKGPAFWGNCLLWVETLRVVYLNHVGFRFKLKLFGLEEVGLEDSMIFKLLWAGVGVWAVQKRMS